MATRKKTTEEVEKKTTVAAATEKTKKGSKVAAASSSKKTAKKKAEPKEAVTKKDSVASPEDKKIANPFFETSQKEVFNTANIGTLSDDIYDIISNERTPQENDALLFRDLKTFERNGEICWGRIYGVEHSNNRALICVLFEKFGSTQKVVIPDEWFFEKDFDFGKNYFKMTDEEKLAKRIRAATYQINSWVCFKVHTVERRLTDDNEYEISIIGNRTVAMETLRDIFFFHKNRKLDSSIKPRTLNVGDIIRNAHVLSVREDSVIVECCGVETKLYAYNLLNNKIVENCAEHVRPGDVIKVMVKKLYINDDETVHLSITGRTGEISKFIKTIQKGGNYVGTVQNYNSEKHTYTVVLDSGVLASVPEANVLGRCILSRGDKVSVYVTNIFEGFVAGSAMKI